MLASIQISCIPIIVLADATRLMHVHTCKDRCGGNDDGKWTTTITQERGAGVKMKKMEEETQSKRRKRKKKKTKHNRTKPRKLHIKKMTTTITW